MSQKENVSKLFQNAETDNTWKDKARHRVENKSWILKSAQVALRVLNALEQAGKTQAWLAEQMGVSEQYVNKVLRGKENLTLDTIGKLEKALDITLLSIMENVQFSREKYTLHEIRSTWCSLAMTILAKRIIDESRIEYVSSGAEWTHGCQFKSPVNLKKKPVFQETVSNQFQIALAA